VINARCQQGWRTKELWAMRGVIKAIAAAAVLATVMAPARARAEGYVSPFAGVHFGNDEIEKKFVWGADAGYMGAGVFGVEADFGYAPNAFDEPVDNHIMDVMGNLIIGIPVGGTHGAGVRPYVTGGIGLVQTKIDTGIGDSTSNDFGFNVGGGVMGFFSNHVGLRGDVRYFRSFENNSTFDNGINIDLKNFDFWRGSIGVVIR
jgi:opacity protein-like surface antigen